MKEALKHPFTKVVFMYAIFVVLGTILLQLGIFINPGEKVQPLDALFTSVSAFATTGLTVFDYTAVYNDLGQLLLIIFFNIGGMGIITLNTVLFIIIGKKIGIKNRMLAKIDLNKENTSGLIDLVKTIILTFLITELIATILVFIKIGYMHMDFSERLINSLFMVSSAITGSGFYNTVPYNHDFFVLSILIFLMIFSFIGYPVILDLIGYIKHIRVKTQRKYKFSNFTKIVVMVNAITLFMFAGIFLVLEWDNTLVNNNLFEKIYYSIYISTSTKSVGLNVFPDITLFKPVTLLTSTIFMIIGGSPSSACGGIRVTSVYVIYIYIKSEFNRSKQVVYAKNYVSDRLVLKAFYVSFMFMFISFIGYLLIVATNTGTNLFYLWYDVISAITTTGFSTGAVNTLNQFGILILTILMFIGRIGIINLVSAFQWRKKAQPRVGYIEKDIII